MGPDLFDGINLKLLDGRAQPNSVRVLGITVLLNIFKKLDNTVLKSLPLDVEFPVVIGEGLLHVLLRGLLALVDLLLLVEHPVDLLDNSLDYIGVHLLVLVARRADLEGIVTRQREEVVFHSL